MSATLASGHLPSASIPIRRRDLSLSRRNFGDEVDELLAADASRERQQLVALGRVDRIECRDQ